MGYRRQKYKLFLSPATGLSLFVVPRSGHEPITLFRLALGEGVTKGLPLGKGSSTFLQMKVGLGMSEGISSERGMESILKLILSAYIQEEIPRR